MSGGLHDDDRLSAGVHCESFWELTLRPCGVGITVQSGARSFYSSCTESYELESDVDDWLWYLVCAVPTNIHYLNACSNSKIPLLWSLVDVFPRLGSRGT